MKRLAWRQCLVPSPAAVAVSRAAPHFILAAALKSPSENQSAAAGVVKK